MGLEKDVEAEDLIIRIGSTPYGFTYLTCLAKGRYTVSTTVAIPNSKVGDVAALLLQASEDFPVDHMEHLS